MKRPLTFGIGMALLVVATGAAAAVTTYHATLRDHDAPGSDRWCGAVHGTASFSSEDGILTGTAIVYSAKPATTTVLYGPPAVFVDIPCAPAPCTLRVDFRTPGYGNEVDGGEAALAAGKLQFLYQGFDDETNNVSGYVLPDDGSIADPCTAPQTTATNSSPSSSSSNGATVPVTSTPLPGGDPLGCSTSGPRGSSSSGLVAVATVLALAALTRRRRPRVELR